MHLNEARDLFKSVWRHLTSAPNPFNLIEYPAGHLRIIGRDRGETLFEASIDPSLVVQWACTLALMINGCEYSPPEDVVMLPGSQYTIWSRSELKSVRARA
jgi:hypothetical protein